MILNKMIAATAALLAASTSQGAVVVFTDNLAGFTAAAGNIPVQIDFDNIAAGTNITGNTIKGVTFQGPGAPLTVVRGADTFTPGGFSGVVDANTNRLFPTSGENVLSPGGLELAPGPNAALENDDLTLTFSNPLRAFGLDILYQRRDTSSNVRVTIFDGLNNVIFPTAVLPMGAGPGTSGGATFYGFVSDSNNIASIVFNDVDQNSENPDSNIGFDSLRFVPEPSTWAMGILGLAVIAIRQRRSR